MIKIDKRDINLYDTLLSGQVFRVTLESDGSFTVILSDRVINIKEEESYLVIDSNNSNDLESIVINYLDLERDYNNINNHLVSKDIKLKNDISKCYGFKVLKQDKFEMFITYIISQNNNVKRITNIVNKLSNMYGDKVIFRTKEYYLFPKFNQIKNISIEELRLLGLGFRDKYVFNALSVLKSNNNYLNMLEEMDTESAIKSLSSINGIGLKVASCILLFAYSRFDTYPIDTWVKKYISENYNIKSDVKSISKYMNIEYGEYSGLVIQYFYHISRNKKGNI